MEDEDRSCKLEISGHFILWLDIDKIDKGLQLEVPRTLCEGTSLLKRHNFSMDQRIRFLWVGTTHHSTVQAHLFQVLMLPMSALTCPNSKSFTMPKNMFTRSVSHYQTTQSKTWKRHPMGKVRKEKSRQSAIPTPGHASDNLRGKPHAIKSHGLQPMTMQE